MMTGSGTPGLHASSQVGDFLFLCVQNDTGSIGTPTNWTSRANVAGSFSRIQVFSKVYDGSETMPSLGISAASKAIIVTWRGVSATTPLDVTTVTLNTSSDPSNTSITPITDNCVVVCVFGCGQSRTISGWTPSHTIELNSTSDPYFGIRYFTKTPAGLASISCNWSSAPNTGTFATFALRPG